MAKHLTGVVLYKDTETVAVLLNSGKKEKVPCEQASGDINLGDKVIIFYDFTQMTIKAIEKGPLKEQIIPWAEESPEETEDQIILSNNIIREAFPYV